MMPSRIMSRQSCFNTATTSFVARLTGRLRGSAITRSARIPGTSAADSVPAATSW